RWRYDSLTETAKALVEFKHGGPEHLKLFPQINRNRSMTELRINIARFRADKARDLAHESALSGLKRTHHTARWSADRKSRSNWRRLYNFRLRRRLREKYTVLHLHIPCQDDGRRRSAGRSCGNLGT